ncbi:citrate/2-methylcitrate synthase [uncultured Devosia sp.]|uniref:citrate/2-methylcitrate synthase n=1 Tax=uncultured Devosia sp. TaxID=211434 RepID=UPI0035C97D1E
MDWLSAHDALALLGTQPQTLYANVSRGRIKAKRDPDDSRKSLYRGDDVRRLAQRAAGRRKQDAVAAQAMQWGDPVLPTSISTVLGGRLLYRGRDAVELAETATLEDIAALLWQAPCQLPAQRPVDITGLSTAFVALATKAAQIFPAVRSPAPLAQEAGSVLAVLATSLMGDAAAGDMLHVRLARRWARADATEIIRRTLVLLADHELNASTFAARIAVSTGASLWSGAVAGLATLNGPRHGLAWRAVAALAHDLDHTPGSPHDALRDWLGEGRSVAGMGHPLYPDGDARATALLDQFDIPAPFRQLGEAGEQITGERPNMDFALAAMATAFELPADAPMTLFALARCVGWLAHALEQIAAGPLIRPRARYVGAAAPA